ncbi:MAG: hypothetical protein KIT25_24640 [Enhydrobacter sp.]|nr:MAG: hypothetical protein KIT25_24640 [Enhydrobacter sp.]
MTTLIFLVLGIALLTAVAGRRDVATVLFALSFVGSVAWFVHHLTDPLTVFL